MTLNIQILIEADAEGAFTDREESILAALTCGRTPRFDDDLTFDERLKRSYVRPTGKDEPEAAGVPSTTDDQQKILDQVDSEPEKPKRTRRTKAQIEADRVAEQEDTGPAVLSEDVVETVPDDTRPGATSEEPATEEPERVEDTTALGYAAVENPTAKDALDRATVLVGEGKAALVKQALETLGVERARNITDEQAGDFLSLVEGK